MVLHSNRQNELLIVEAEAVRLSETISQEQRILENDDVLMNPVLFIPSSANHMIISCMWSPARSM